MFKLLCTISILPALVISSLVYWLFFTPPPPIPTLDVEAWWGPQALRGKLDTSIRPFNIKFSDDMIKDLKTRLKSHVPFAPPLQGVGFEYGFNTKAMDDWLPYWAEEYPFKERERFLNQFPQYKTNIQGLDIHFIRVKPQAQNKETVPMLLLHGWPGSVREFYEAIPLLTAVSKNRNFALEVIVPSLPGFGFSDPAVRPGLGPAQIAVIMRNLMHRLGHRKFYIQGGDWGGQICNILATLFPEEVLGFHINFAFNPTFKATVLQYLISFYPTLFMDASLVDRLEYNKMLFGEMGYFHLASTKPDTVGVALTDSPAGLLSYVLEKSSSGTCFYNKYLKDGGMSSWRFTKDEILDNLMMYWVPRSITTSLRLYAESASKGQKDLGFSHIPITVPTWIVQAKYEIYYHPPAILKMKYNNVVNITVLDEGGHFLAWELPGVFAEDVLKAVDAFRKSKESKDEL